MADHVRAQLIAAIKLAVTDLDTTGQNVFGFRINPLIPAQVPGLCVYSTDEESEAITIHGPNLYSRTVQCHVVGYAAANDLLDETLDLIAKEVETALAPALVLDGTSILLTYAGMEKQFEAGETQAGSIDMRFVASLANEAPTPDQLS